MTPPLGSASGWNSERISWFREYHHAAAGLDGPAQQKSWAISSDGKLAGSIRLKRTGADSWKQESGWAAASAATESHGRPSAS